MKLTSTRQKTISVKQFLWAMVRNFPALVGLNLLYWTAMIVLDLAPGLVAKLFFDQLTAEASANLTLNGVVALVFLVAVSQIGSFYGAMIAAARLDFHLVTLLRRNLLARILDLPGASALTKSPGETANVFRDDVGFANYTLSWTIEMVGMIVVILVALITMLTINWQITLLSLIPMVVILVLGQLAERRVETFHQASREATERVTGILGEMFDAVLALQVNAAERHVLAQLQRLSHERRQRIVKDRAYLKLIDSVYGNLGIIGTGLVILFAAQLMRVGEFSVGDFALFVLYLRRVTLETMDLGARFLRYKQSRVSFERMTDLMQLAAPNRPAAAGTLIESQPLFLSDTQTKSTDIADQSAEIASPLKTLTVKGLTYHFEQTEERQVQGISNIDLTLERGTFTVITGRVGAGKSTLLRAMLGLLTPQAGEIFWNDRRVLDPATFFVPPQTAYTPQVQHLFSASIRENLLLHESDEHFDVGLALHRAVLEADVAEMPLGLETVVGTKGVRLSGGQIQRTAAARMFGRQPELHVFDDLSSALDVETEQLLWQRLYPPDCHKRPTCLAVSHRQEVLQLADQIIVLEAGQIADVRTLKMLEEQTTL
ncbi:ABC transporter ATP-binding protein/permease [Chloroflexi bacterium TSY]|nr:ABC transporter ATP-binding protein/permease [Chloroflexi bacterium TSY]